MLSGGGNVGFPILVVNIENSGHFFLQYSYDF
jgi:hypothetical protein